MLISYEQLKEINNIQVEILKDVTKVCEILGINYYMVHGSLLGTVREHKFILGDDDIDIAMKREDYELFLKEGSKYLSENLFIQSNKTDKNYPLEFAKVRDSATTYIVDSVKNINMNHGVYIDVFPIDNCSNNKMKNRLINFIYKLMNIRISGVYDVDEKIIKKIARLFTGIIFPSYEKTIALRDVILRENKEGDYVRLSGGKKREKYIPKEWFDDIEIMSFEGIETFIPKEYHKYLSTIYGDYINRTLIEKKYSDGSVIEVNACLIDVHNSYKKYMG